MLTTENGQKVATGLIFGSIATVGHGGDLQVRGPRGTRTHNPRIKSPLLCQLS
jgi:hypothetical protein